MSMDWFLRQRLFSLWAIALFVPSQGFGQEFQVDLQGENLVQFLSDAPLEDFKGVTHRIDGFVFLAGEGLGGASDLRQSEFHFEVDLGSLDTGLGLRNRHMRDNYLETDRFPYASFSGRVQELTQLPDGAFRVVARGGLTIHGVEQNREIPCRLERVGEVGSGAGGALSLRVQCAFQVTLSHHDIPIPKLMFMKIDEVMELSLDFHLVSISRPREGE